MGDFELIANSIEKKHITNLLEKDRRIDGRTKTDYRDIKIETNVIGTANGSAIVELGNTKVICGVKAVMGTPYSDSPNKGSIMVGFETSPLSSPAYRLGPPQPDAIEIARMTDRVIRESECIDLESLCIVPGEKIWTIIIDLYSLDDNGNFYDTCPIAAYAALANTKIPDVSIDEEGNVEILETTQPLNLQSFPVSITTYKIDDHFVIDASLKEELIADARISFGTTETHIVSGQKGGNSGFKTKDIVEILKQSIKTAAELRSTINEQINKN